MSHEKIKRKIKFLEYSEKRKLTFGQDVEGVDKMPVQRRRQLLGKISVVSG